MSLQEFKIPSIPKIFIPQRQRDFHPNRDESQKVSNKSSNETTKSTTSDKQTSSPNNNTSESAASRCLELPKLCPSCSHKLIAYFVPLQNYINEIVSLAKLQSENPGESTETSFKVTDPSQKSLFLPENANHGMTNSNEEVSNQSNYGSYSKQVDPKPNLSNEKLTNQQAHHQHNANNELSYSTSKSFEHCGDNRSDSNDNISVETSETFKPSDSVFADNRMVGAEAPFQGDQPEKSSYVNAEQNSVNRHQQINLAVERERYTEGHLSATETSKLEERENNGDRRPGESDSGFNATDKSHNDKTIRTSLSPNETVTRPVDTNQMKTLADDFNELSVDQTDTKSPYAFVTIAYNNLTATNAILLANSIILTNNKTMLKTDDKMRKKSIEIPLVILIGGKIDPILKEALETVFTEVISQPMDIRLALLSDESCGVYQYKIQLWKELVNYKKCLFLESSTLVVGQVTNLFEECQELSACVDWLFTDNFNCSVFVFEPSFMTYEGLINFALNHQRESEIEFDYGTGGMDEMTLLNCFFASKWNRISFIYNFVRNNEIYTQQPAFMKFGGSIRIVNFGSVNSTSNFSSQPTLHPWHVQFDLLMSNQKDVNTSTPVDNYAKFYLNIFLKRLWPLLQNHLSSIVMSSYGMNRRFWCIFELIRLLSNESGNESDDHIFNQSPINLRRIKSATENLAQYEHLDSEIYTEMIDDDNVDEEITSEDKGISVVAYPDEEESEIASTSIVKDDVQTSESSELSENKNVDVLSGMKEWEAGRIDWMGAHQSDLIVNRIKSLIKE